MWVLVSTNSKLPINEKYSRIRAYLLYVVTIAEEKWGAGMGQLNR